MSPPYINHLTYFVYVILFNSLVSLYIFEAVSIKKFTVQEAQQLAFSLKSPPHLYRKMFMWHIKYFYLRVCITRFIRVAAGLPQKKKRFFSSLFTNCVCMFQKFFYFTASFLCCCCFGLLVLVWYIGVVSTIMDLSDECIVCVQQIRVFFLGGQARRSEG